MNEEMVEKLLKFIDEEGPNISETLFFEKNEVIEDWLKESKDNLKSCKQAYETGNNKKAVHELHQTVEKLVKAHALRMGLMKEKDLRKIGHTPLKLYLDLLSKSYIEKLPEIINSNVNLKESRRVLNDLTNLKKSKNRIAILQLDKDVSSFLTAYENGYVKPLDKSINDLKTNMDFDIFDLIPGGENFIRVELGFAGLMFLAALVSVYYEPSKYPDAKRKLSIDFDKLETVKNMERIITFLDDHIERIFCLINENSN